MNDNPYAAPQAELVPATHSRFRWKSALAAAALAFIAFPLFLLVLAAVSGIGAPDFLLEPGFLGTLALVSAVSAFVLERLRLSTWLYLLLTTALTTILFVGSVVVLRAITR